ncbi:hypothetical protein AOLI_G00052090 [Acnodon oligacanthus]
MSICLPISLFKMRLSACCLPVLSFSVLITVVYSASLKDQNEEFLRFLTDAFNMNDPPESPARDIIPDTSNSFNPPDPTAVCTTPGPVDDSAEIPSVTQEPGSLTFSVTADEKSKENSNSADRTDDSDYRGSKKKNRLPETLKQSLDNNSADSDSTEMAYTDTHVTAAIEEQPRKTQGPAIEDRSSEEMDGDLDFETYRERKRMTVAAKRSEEHGLTGITETRATDSHSSDQSHTKDRKRENKTDMPVNRNSAKVAVKQVRDSPLSDSPGSIDQDLDCIDLSSRSMESLNREDTSIGGPNTDPQNKAGITNYENELRRMCAGRKRLGAPSIPKEQLDTDSVERVNSELLDRDNSNDMTGPVMPAHSF